MCTWNAFLKEENKQTRKQVARKRTVKNVVENKATVLVLF